MFARGKLCATASNYDSTSRCPRFSGCSGWPALEAPWASCVAYTSAGRKGLVNNSTASVIMGADRSHARIPSTQASMRRGRFTPCIPTGVSLILS